MTTSDARTPDECVASLPEDRRAAIEAVRGSSRRTRAGEAVERSGRP